uniref:Pentatricopeptide repeat-containing protein n=1 Tax=Aegilops tauschii subsp. strangulata TaxID=200361 RepID=A0A453A6K6_AEGTS
MPAGKSTLTWPAHGSRATPSSTTHSFTCSARAEACSKRRTKCGGKTWFPGPRSSPGTRRTTCRRRPLRCYPACSRGASSLTYGFTFASVLKAAGAYADSGVGGQIHALAMKCDWNEDVYVGSALVDMYARCGRKNGVSLERSDFLVFKEGRRRNSFKGVGRDAKKWV